MTEKQDEKSHTTWKCRKTIVGGILFMAVGSDIPMWRKTQSLRLLYISIILAVNVSEQYKSI